MLSQKKTKKQVKPVWVLLVGITIILLSLSSIYHLKKEANEIKGKCDALDRKYRGLYEDYPDACVIREQLYHTVMYLNQSCLKETNWEQYIEDCGQFGRYYELVTAEYLLWAIILLLIIIMIVKVRQGYGRKK